jgi:hypothetical protein
LLFDYLTPSWLFNVEQSLIDLVPLDKKESAGVEQRGWDTPHFAGL